MKANQLVAIEYKSGIFSLTTFFENGELDVSKTGHSIETIMNYAARLWGRTAKLEVTNLERDSKKFLWISPKL